jgi:carbon monoxide dehydrogenase subunit G
MALEFNNAFTVPANPELVWKIMTTPSIAVPCMPGALIEELLGASGFKGLVNLRVGPVQLQFKGDGEFKDLNYTDKSGLLYVKGSDTKGRGTFIVDMNFVLVEEGLQTLVQVHTTLKLSGMVAQYGRGMGVVKEITTQLTNQFAKNISDQVTNNENLSENSANIKSASDPSTIIRENSQLTINESTQKDNQPSIDVLRLIFMALISSFKNLIKRILPGKNGL